MAKIILSVINDLVTDQRVHRVASSLQAAGYDVMLTGRKLKNSYPVKDRTYSTKRLRLLFNKGFLFYAEYNIRLFFFLLFKKADILVANDLDTLLANFIASKLKRKKLVYDSHEYFTEVPELQGRDFARNIWLRIERCILPKVRYSYTVCDSIAEIYNKKYGIDMQVVRNLPVSYSGSPAEKKIDAGDRHIILYQGSLNIGRGIGNVISAMQYIDNAVFVIIGDGDITGELKDLVQKNNLQEKVIFTGKIPLDELHLYTQQADIGISLEENRGLNYYYSLPNKLFNYIQAHVPVLTNDFPEVKKIVEGYDIGITVSNYDPEFLAAKIKYMLEPENRADWKNNLGKASRELCWQNEEGRLLEIFRQIK